jgi:hypothetical protein
MVLLFGKIQTREEDVWYMQVSSQTPVRRAVRDPAGRLHPQAT